MAIWGLRRALFCTPRIEDDQEDPEAGQHLQGNPSPLEDPDGRIQKRTRSHSLQSRSSESCAWTRGSRSM